MCRPARRPRLGRARRSGVLLCRLCACLFLLFFCVSPPAPAFSVPEEGAEVSLPFGGNIPESAARSVARALAWHKVLASAAQHPAVSALSRTGVDSALHREALAGAACVPVVQSKTARRKSLVRVFPATPLQSSDEQLHKILRSPGMLETRAALLAQEKALAAETAALLEEAAVLRHRGGHGADAPLKARILLSANRLEGLWLFGRALSLRENERWSDPRQALHLLSQAAELHTDCPFLYCALGEVFLQLDRPQDALEALNKAADTDMPPAGALYARGLTYLRLQMPSLAEQDLNAALERDPRPAAWWRARGALHMMQGSDKAMCADFLEACARGDCEGAILARERGRCLPEPDKKQP